MIKIECMETPQKHRENYPRAERTVFVNGKAKEVRHGIFETEESALLLDEQTEAEHNVPLRRVWRNDEGRMVAFVEWKYGKDEKGRWCFQEMAIQGMSTEGEPGERSSIKCESRRIDAVGYVMNDMVGRTERVVKLKDGKIVRVCDIRTNDDHSRVATTWLPTVQHGRQIWRGIVHARRASGEEYDKEEISFAGPFEQEFGVVWPDVHGKKVGVVEPAPWEIAWPSVDPNP